jgi:hypothetical protein
VSSLVGSFIFACASAFSCRVFLACIGEKDFSASRFTAVVAGAGESGCSAFSSAPAVRCVVGWVANSAVNYGSYINE